MCRGKWKDIPLHPAYAEGNLVTAPAWLREFRKVLGTGSEA